MTESARLRVLHCIYDDPHNPWVGGGGARRVFDLYRRIGDRVDVTIATGRYPGARIERIVPGGGTVIRLGRGRPYLWSRLTYAFSAAALLRRGDYDVAVVDYSAYAPVRVPAGRPVGITVHHLYTEAARQRWGVIGGASMGWLERALLRRASAFSATSRTTAAMLSAVTRPDARIDIVLSGVPDELFTIERRERDYLLYVGRLDERHKGLDVLLDAFALLRATHPRIRLKIAGRGPAGEPLRARAVALGIERDVDFLGGISDDERATLLSGALAMLMPSRFEGFGIAAAEGMAAGVPMIVSDAGALPEVVDAPHAGVSVPANDAIALAAATSALLDDPVRRRQLGERARRTAERYRWDAVVEGHLAFLRRITAN